jgi:hypothetical protein
MTWLLVAALVVFGLALLVAAVLRVAAGLRRFNSLRRAVLAVIRDEVGLLRARAAALKVAFRQRRRLTRPPRPGVS